MQERPTTLSAEARALAAIRKLRHKLEQVTGQLQQPIAIVGMACRFPHQANDLGQYWRLFDERIDGIEEVPAERWDIDSWYDPDPTVPGRMCTRWGGFIDEVDRFDANFFGITPREAIALDPQQRVLLETSWTALEDAHLDPLSLAGSATGVFLGVYNQDYGNFYGIDADAYAATGNANSFAAGRVAYLLDLRGPTMVVDTVCSSSLVAVHLAISELRAGRCDVALAAGVNLILAPQSTVAVSRLLALARDGRCKSFDSRADGFVRGEGCGVLVLKRLSDAIADGERRAPVADEHAPRRHGPVVPAAGDELAVESRQPD